MDLITQTVLGAAVGEVVLGKKAGNKAILWGAVAGLIPDLDVLVTPFFSEVDALFVHRGFSHSIIFAFLLAPVLGFLLYRIHHKRMSITQLEWTKLVFWAAFTHPLLDYFTTYGTGAFLPFSGHRLEFSTIGIVDIFYTIPIILVLLLILFIKRTSKFRRNLIVFVVIATSTYLAATVVNKIYVNTIFKTAYKDHNISFERYKTIPLPLTNFLWMGIAEYGSGYYMALYSNFDTKTPDEFIYIPRNEHKLNHIRDNEVLKKLIRFTKGYYHVNEDDGGLYLADLRFGKSGIQEDADYIFKFYIKETDGELLIEESNESRKIEGNDFEAFIHRIRGI